MIFPDELPLIVQEALWLARTIPPQLLQPFAEMLAGSQSPDWAAMHRQLVQQFAPPQYRALVSRFLERWQTAAPAVSPAVVAASLLTAIASVAAHPQEQTVELVWTGPTSGVLPLRQTEQALLQLIHSAQSSLLVVSYAVYKIPRISAALLDAARRNVHITLIIETPDRLAGENAYNTLNALGADVANHCQVYYWPQTMRPADAQGRTGIFHPKCAVADDRWLFLSSANLTEYAFTVNQELGVLITGGPLPAQVNEHFQALIRRGVFQKVMTANE